MKTHLASFSTGNENGYYESNNKLKVMEAEEKFNNMDKIIQQNEIIIKQNKAIISMLSPKPTAKESRKDKYKKSIVDKS